MRSFGSLHFKSFVFGSFAAGIPLYGLYGYTIYKSKYKLDSNEIESENRNDKLISTESKIKPIQNKNQEEWELSFKTQLLYKLIHFQFDEIKKSEVFIECLLLSFPLLCTTILSFRLYRKQQSLWNSQHLYNSINISINTVSRDINKPSKYKCRIRTILEKPINEIIPNEQGIKELINCAEKTSKSMPFIRFNSEKQKVSIHNLIKDHIISLSHSAFIAEDILDAPDAKIKAKYIMSITVGPWDLYGKNYNKKIRVSLVKKDSIKKLVKEIGVESKEEWIKALHTGFPERWEILYEIARKFGGRYSSMPPIHEVELAIPSLYEKHISSPKSLETNVF